MFVFEERLKIKQARIEKDLKLIHEEEYNAFSYSIWLRQLLCSTAHFKKKNKETTFTDRARGTYIEKEKMNESQLSVLRDLVSILTLISDRIFEIFFKYVVSERRDMFEKDYYRAFEFAKLEIMKNRDYHQVISKYNITPDEMLKIYFNIARKHDHNGFMDAYFKDILEDYETKSLVYLLLNENGGKA